MTVETIMSSDVGERLQYMVMTRHGQANDDVSDVYVALF